MARTMNMTDSRYEITTFGSSLVANAPWDLKRTEYMEVLNSEIDMGLYLNGHIVSLRTKVGPERRKTHIHAAYA